MSGGTDSDRHPPVGGMAFVLTVGLLFGAVAVGVGVDPAAASTEIDECTVINDSTVPASGVVELNRSVTGNGSSPCIEVTTSDLIVDGGGHVVNGSGSTAAIAVGNGTEISNVTVRNVVVENDGGDGVHYNTVTGGAVENVDARSVSDGVVLESTSGVEVSGVTVSSPGGSGVYLTFTDDARVSNVDITDAGGDGVVVNGGSGNTLVDLRVDGAANGVYAEAASDTRIERTTIVDARSHGVSLVASGGSVVRDVTVRRPANDGVNVVASSDVTVGNATVRNAGGDGIYVTGQGADDDRTFNTETRTVTLLGYASDGRLAAHDGPPSPSEGPVTTVVDSTVTNASGTGIHVDYSAVEDPPVVHVADSTVTESGSGITVYSFDEVVVDGVTVERNYGVGVVASPGDPEIRNTVARNNGDGIIVGGNATLHNVTVAGNENVETGNDLVVVQTATATDLTVGATTLASAALRGVALDEASSIPAAPDEMADLGLAFNAIDFDEGEISSYANVTFRYAQERADAVPVNESTLAVHRYDGANWSRVDGGAVDPAENTVSANVTSFSVVAPLGEVDEPPEAALTASTTATSVGQSMTFDAGASTDPDSGIEQYEWDFDGDGTYDRTTGSPTVEYDYGDGGSFDATVRVTTNGLTDTASVTVDVSSGGDSSGVDAEYSGPDISVTDVEGPSGPVSPGEAVEVRATLVNDGGAGATRTVHLTANGRTVAERSVTVGAEQRREVTLTYAPSEAGEYTLRVNDRSVGTLVVGDVATAEPTATPARSPTPTATATPASGPTATPAPTPTEGGGPGFGVVVALCALLAAALAATRR
ncbi:MAG: right-handed parallel beta-helix repeat-containing protein [Haloferacaceae archaeon]